LTGVRFPGAGAARHPGPNPPHAGAPAAAQRAHEPASAKGSEAIGPTTAVLKKSLSMRSTLGRRSDRGLIGVNW